MAVHYVREKSWEAVYKLVTAIAIKDGLDEALQLLIAAHMHASDLPPDLKTELDAILHEGSKRESEVGRGDIPHTIHGMRFKTAQALAARIFEFYECVRDL